MVKPFVALALLAGLALPAAAQTTFLTQSAAAQEVQSIAPQLLAFAGSQANFNALVDGLALGQPVTLVTTALDGSTQTTTFTPAGTLTPVQVAQTLEAARQQLIAQGIANPTAQQLGTSLAGGTFPTATGTASTVGLIPVVTNPSSSTGASAPIASSSSAPSTATSGATTVTTPPSALQRPAATRAVPAAIGAQVAPSTPAVAAPSAPVQFTSDSPLLGNTSNTPVTPAVSGPNGPPSPAAQLQNRR